MRESSGGTKSIPKVFGNIFISFIGAGVLGLPYAFKEVSLVPELNDMLDSQFIL